ncbi:MULTISPECIES: helix-turn-helix domain-containing protein [unclassified Fusibacter]|uniref:helix-turn-helix domain-containing protein n=1 Tax=unclassified Fusibacter TaxID=2624464 RepID=UPI001012C363|nr:MULTISPECIES: helix-turn-helix domain-containing protein [unclassified Fusibacter]MCK8058514.1 helix-turn-helix domain-containing protein [Fusibacter sp. A2]NPE22717.1 helix-turn-helix domain-containing protein [Fusibacter sp. A1]RXV60277.1 helix-turn-helix domain-containing protein [Fusibacter sp. A1]
MDENEIKIYIQNQIGQPIDSKVLADLVKYSKPHFNMLFKDKTGMTVKRYILNARLSEACIMLMDKEKQLTEIALDLGFEHYDTFRRAFKAKMCMTPSVYRRIQSECDQKGESKMNHEIIKQLKSCSDEDKNKALELVKEVLVAAQHARSNGLVALSDLKLPLLGRMEFYKKALSLMIDGTDPDLLSQVLETILLVGNYSSLELLERTIVLVGITEIQKGTNIQLQKPRLLSLLGEGYINKLEELSGDSFKRTEIMALLAGMDKSYETSNDVVTFEKLIRSFDKRSLQRILREVKVDIAAKAIVGLQSDVQQSLVDALFGANLTMLLNDLEFYPCSFEVTVIAQKNIINTISMLRTAGDLL